MIRVLHVASFSGNIGDCANHLGLRSQLEKIGDFEYTDLEIRHSYQNYIGPCRWEWDQSFVDRCNQYDMVIIGGGNYFEPRWETPNGTTAGINSDDLAKIKVPVVFFGVGFDCYKGVNPSSIRRFSRFIGRASRMKHVLMSCRNDGSLKQLKEQLPIADLPIQVVPDGGFFCSTEMQSGTFHQLMEGKKYWAVNVSCDLINLGLSGIAANLAKRLTQSDHYVLFIPHITSDLRAISQILDRLPADFIREQVTVAPLMTGWEGAEQIFPLYDCEKVMAMRFHANVVPLAMGVDVEPIFGYPKIKDLYEELAETGMNLTLDPFLEQVERML